MFAFNFSEIQGSGLKPSALQGSGGIPLTRKICYAVGGVPNQVTTAAMATSLQIFLLDVVQVEFLPQGNILSVLTFTIKCIPQMEAFYVSLVLFVSRVWDAVSDPLIGYLVGRSPWTGIGKLSPWLVGWWRSSTLTHSRRADAGCPLSQAGSVHPVWRPVLPAAVVWTSGTSRPGGRLCSLVPRDHLPV